MERFKLDDMDDGGFDMVEPMRASSFDMSFTLSNERLPSAFVDSNNDYHFGANDHPNHQKQQLYQHMDELTLNEKGRLHADDLIGSSTTADGGSNTRLRNKSNATKKDVLTTAQKLEEKAQETIAAASLCGKIPWRLTKRVQDVHIYRPARPVETDNDSSKVYFRVSCEMKANLGTIMEYLSPNNSKSYFDIESQVFPGLLHAAVIKRMEIPEKEKNIVSNQSDNDDFAGENATEQSSTVDDEDTDDTFRRLQIKWHASRFAGRFVKPVDFFFVEYANVETMADGRKRGYGYIRSLESFKSDELAIRLNNVDDVIPQSVSKCKRAVINKGIYIVSPSGDTVGTYEVTFMMVIDFEKQFASTVGAKIIQNFMMRLIGIRELLFNTLFQPVNLVPKEQWKPAKSNKCAICLWHFSIVKPLHHCRACGEAVCGQCSRKWVVQPGAQKETQTRLCTSCSLQARKYLLPESSARSPTRISPAAVRNPSLSSSHGSISTSSISQNPRMINISTCDVKVASALSTEINAYSAVSSAFSALTSLLDGQAPHFMMVTYTCAHDGSSIYEALARVAPDTLFMGGSSSAGVFSTTRVADNGPAVGLWGIYDPEGSYAVLNADLTTETPRDATRRCLLQGMEMLCMEPEDSPDFIWTNICDGHEDIIIKTINEVVDCSFSVIGGSSSRTPIDRNARPATQICSEGADIGCVTSHGACFAICSPSVEVSNAFFTCYEPKDKSFVVTKANGRELLAVDQKPAFTALNDACHGMLYEYINRPERYNCDHNTLPIYYPIARERPKQARSTKTSRHQLLQPEQARQDMVLLLGAEVRVGEKLRMMSIASGNVPMRMKLGFREALRASIPVLDGQDIIGCLMSVSINYEKILNGDLKSVVEATGRSLPCSAVLGSISQGQQGVLLGANEVVHANGMMTCLLITNRKKSQKLNPLRPLTLRRLSTC